ncbi:MAG TPA: hypothetical protein VNJ12_03645 [Candidatus Dormibacteraeota bacterium]|nr:hypothetical protein [Candidatus Dormibacteraeota bacterium]
MASTGSIGRCSLVSLVSLFLILAPALSPSVLANAQQAAQAPDHVVSSAELQNDLAAASGKRQAHIAALEELLSTARARRVLKSAGMNYQVVRHAIPLLSSQELARLSARAERANHQFRAGSLSNQQLTYIIIALATAVIVIILVKS